MQNWRDDGFLRDVMVDAKNKPRVALLIETSRAYGRGVHQGVAEYAHQDGGWEFIWQESDLRGGAPEWLRDWQGDGIICRLIHDETAALVAAAACPVVDVCGLIRHPQIPFLDTDAVGVAQMAAQFFLDSAYTSFAFCGYPGLWFSDEREQAFVEILTMRGYQVRVYTPPQAWQTRDIAARESLHPEGSAELAAWAASLPNHTAVFACNDFRAQQLLVSAVRAGRKVPEELAILGVDNDELICNLSSPPLSSIGPDTRGLGQMAAHWLKQMMSGDAPPVHSQVLRPLSLHERASTDLICSDDELFVKAARFIREFNEPTMTADSVAAHLHCSRSSLDKHFQAQLGRSLTQEIGRVRILKVEMLLRDNRMKLDAVALACGFATASHFSRVFKEATGWTPGQYRQRHLHPEKY